MFCRFLGPLLWTGGSMCRATAQSLQKRTVALTSAKDISCSLPLQVLLNKSLGINKQYQHFLTLFLLQMHSPCWFICNADIVLRLAFLHATVPRASWLNVSSFRKEVTITAWPTSARQLAAGQSLLSHITEHQKADSSGAVTEAAEMQLYHPARQQW